MDFPDYIIVEPERKPGQHLQREDRGGHPAVASSWIFQPRYCQRASLPSDNHWKRAGSRNAAPKEQHRPSTRVFREARSGSLSIKQEQMSQAS